MSGVLCLFSMLHSMMLLLRFQSGGLWLCKEKSELLFDAFLCLLFSLRRMSSASVVFDFSASLSDVTPLSLIMLSVCVKKKKEKSGLLMDVLCVSSFFCLHFSV